LISVSKPATASLYRTNDPILVFYYLATAL